MEVQESMGLDFASVLKEAVTRKSVNEQKHQFYPGKIVDNNDPEKIGRCRIMVFGVFDGIPTENLPWAIPDFGFIGSTIGSFTVPPVDSIVNVYFDCGDIYLPKYTTKVLTPSSVKNMVSDIEEDYPNTMVLFETDNGDYFRINRTSKSMELQHSSGSFIRIDRDGNMKIFAAKNLEIRSEGEIVMNASNDVSIYGRKIKLPSKDGTTQVWQPNVCPNCLFTGVPHGGNMAGVMGLGGSDV